MLDLLCIVSLVLSFLPFLFLIFFRFNIFYSKYFYYWDISDITLYLFQVYYIIFDIYIIKMIKTISPVNIHYHTVITFFLWELSRSTLLTNFKTCKTVLLTVLTMLYITSHDSLYNQKFVTLTPFTHSSPPWCSRAHFGKPPICSLYWWAHFCCFYFFKFYHKWDHSVSIFSPLTYFSYHSTFRYIHDITNDKISFFFL